MRGLTRQLVLPAAVLAVVVMSGASAPAGGEGSTHGVLSVLGALVVVLCTAKVGGAAFAAVRLPAVLGELVGGILLGNLSLLGVENFASLRHDPTLEMLGQIGVILLLFGVGLESDVAGLARVGAASLRVALLGVIAPLVLGFVVAARFFPHEPSLSHWFVGGILCATSVGITARVLADLGRTASREGQIILGAAVLDDVLGLVVLAVIAGIVQARESGGAFSAVTVLVIVGKCAAFLAAALWGGRRVARAIFRAAAVMPGEGAVLSGALVACFGFAWLAGVLGLAPIVGAFAAGLLVEEARAARGSEAPDLDEQLRPLRAFLVPVFFVLMGLQVDLAAVVRPDILLFGAVLTATALVSKQLCSLGVAGTGADGIAVGLGMIPRGEVGLIFAGIGAGLSLAGRPLVGPEIYSAAIIVVTVTTLLTPPLLAARFRQLARRNS